MEPMFTTWVVRSHFANPKFKLGSPDELHSITWFEVYRGYEEALATFEERVNAGPPDGLTYGEIYLDKRSRGGNPVRSEHTVLKQHRFV